MEAEDLYASEQQALRIAVLNLERFEFTWDSNAEKMKRQFEQAAREELGKAGFTCHVHWEEVVKRTPLGDIPTGVWCPSLQDVHRLVPEVETDHDRMRHDIVTGKIDGIKGYIREDGSRHEDPIKKTIT
jgi:hypothetical protein